jgi:hypothetical protein
MTYDVRQDYWQEVIGQSMRRKTHIQDLYEQILYELDFLGEFYGFCIREV